MNLPKSESLGAATISQVLQRLCDFYARNAKNQQETAYRMFKFCSTFLVRSSHRHDMYDEEYVVNEIRKVLPHKRDSFDVVYAKLQKSTVLRSKTSLLVLFLNLYKDQNSTQSEYTLLQQLNQLKYLNIEQDSKSQLIFIPDDGSKSVNKLYIAPSGNTINSARSEIPNSSTSSESQYQLNIRDKTSSSISCIYVSAHGFSEYEIMQEIIYSLQGIEGKILKKEMGGYGFVVDSKVAKRLRPTQIAVVERLAGIGFLHNLLKNSCEQCDKEKGVIIQSLNAIFRQKLAAYYEAIAILQTQVKKRNSNLTLRRMLVYTADQYNNLQWLAHIAEKCTGNKGGKLISAVYAFSHHGSTTVQKISNDVLLAVCRPLYVMLSCWLLDGELNDACGEFFIQTNRIEKHESLWHKKYSINVEMVPTFISLDQATKILNIGKNINYLRQECRDFAELPGKEALQKLFTTISADCLYLPYKCLDFHLNLEAFHRETSDRVLYMLKDKYQLLEHLQALRRYLLLGQGDFIRHFLELLVPELCKPADRLYLHTFSGILESAIRVTNAQYEDEEVLKRLSIDLLQNSHGDTGWDIFTLVYICDGPIGTILNDASCSEYKSLFGSLWKAKRMEYVLSNMRKQQISGAKLFKNIKELRPILHDIHILSSAMIHFLHQTQYYFLFEVMECSWAEMMRKVNQAESLDHVIKAHDEFLNSVRCGVLLDNGSEEMSSQIRTIYNLILKLESTQEALYIAVSDEHKELLQLEKHTIESKKNGKFPTSLELDKQIKQRTIKFHDTLNFTKGQIKQISYRYKRFVEKYLYLLSISSDLNLQLLSVRLNFNDFYKIA